jgi:hypothetical protein
LRLHEFDATTSTSWLPHRPRAGRCSFSVELAVAAVGTIAVLSQQFLPIRSGTRSAVPASDFVRVFGPIYVGVLTVL